MFTCASPPRKCPTSASEKSKIRCEMPPKLSRLPASTKSGIASSGKLSMPGAIRCTTTDSGICEPNAR